MLFDAVVATSRAVAGTRSRTAKAAALADLLSRLDADEVVPAVSWLSGTTRQGRLGVGWTALSAAMPEPAAAASLTITAVDAAFGELQATTGTGSGGRRAALLTALLGGATAEEQDHLRRLLLGEVRQGALDGVMAEAVAAAAKVPVDAVRRAHMLTGDLGVSARTALAGSETALAAIGLEVLRPVRPMLASTASTVEQALASTGPASVEYKLDGARIQVHRDGDDVRVFTRSLADVTARLPEVVAVTRSLPARRLVLDGESLMLDTDERPRPFQETQSRFGTQMPSERLLRPYFFDVLHIDGTDLLDRPLGERLSLLEHLAGEHRIPGRVTDDPRAGDRILTDALAAGQEGVMVKALTSTYSAGRRGRLWQKVKPVHSLDLVVLAAEWGHGRRRGWLSNLHLAALDPDGEVGEPGGRVMVGKTFKGLTDALLTWQTEQLLARETHRDGRAVHVRPELVVEVALDGVQGSTRYPGGVALRFARVLRYRDDKTPAEADTIATVRALGA